MEFIENEEGQEGKVVTLVNEFVESALNSTSSVDVFQSNLYHLLGLLKGHASPGLGDEFSYRIYPVGSTKGIPSTHRQIMASVPVRFEVERVEGERPFTNALVIRGNAKWVKGLTPIIYYILRAYDSLSSRLIKSLDYPTEEKRKARERFTERFAESVGDIFKAVFSGSSEVVNRSEGKVSPKVQDCAEETFE